MMIGTPEGMAMFLVQFVLSNKGKDYKGKQAVVNVEALDLEEVFHIVQEDISIQFQIEEFINMNYGELVFDAWRPVMILEYVLDEDRVIDTTIEPPVVWSEEDNGTFH